jgi:hypothetical protein
MKTGSKKMTALVESHQSITNNNKNINNVNLISEFYNNYDYFNKLKGL